MSVIY